MEYLEGNNMIICGWGHRPIENKKLLVLSVCFFLFSRNVPVSYKICAATVEKIIK
jgi:hypothetical protein